MLYKTNHISLVSFAVLSLVLVGCSSSSDSSTPIEQNNQINSVTSAMTGSSASVSTSTVTEQTGGATLVDTEVDTEVDMEVDTIESEDNVSVTVLPETTTSEDTTPNVVEVNVTAAADTAEPVISNTDTESDPIVSSPVVTNTADQSSTRVNFDITVPVYQSNALQVGVIWGDRALNAEWVVDESWVVVDDLPADAELPLFVTFYDQNGAITLGSVETSVKTGTGESTNIAITADQFDTALWDDNDDGVSNLAELMAGNDPTVTAISNNVETSGGFNFIDVADDLIHTTSGCQMTRLAAVVSDLSYIIEQTSTTTWPDTDYYQVQLVPNFGADNQAFATVCEGGPDCKLLPGRHAVINQTSGERTLLTVPRIEPEDNPAATVLANIPFTSNDSEYAVVSGELAPIQYACENGGTFVREKGDTFSRFSYFQENFVFNQCEMTVRTGMIPDGNYVLNGTLKKSDVGNHYDSNLRYQYEDFSIVGENGLEYHVQGNVLHADGYYKPYRQTASISSYIKQLPDNAIGEKITNVEFAYGSREGYLLDIGGTFQNDKTADQSVTIRTDMPFNFEIENGSSTVITPLIGSMEMLAEGGGFLNVNATPTSPQDTLRQNLFTFDVEHTAENGDVFLGTQSIYRPNVSERTCGYRYISGGAGFRRSTVVREIP